MPDCDFCADFENWDYIYAIAGAGCPVCGDRELQMEVAWAFYEEYIIEKSPSRQRSGDEHATEVLT